MTNIDKFILRQHDVLLGRDFIFGKIGALLAWAYEGVGYDKP